MNFLKKVGSFLYKYWMKFAHLLGTINGAIILSAFYIVVIGLYCIVLKTMRLFRRRSKDAPVSYWQDKTTLGEKNLESVKYQF